MSLNTLFGNAGNDIISGGAGNDVLIGGAGNDTLTGGTGIDRMIFEEVGAANQDTINAYLGTGADRDIIDLSGLLDATFNGVQYQQLRPRRWQRSRHELDRAN